MDCPKGFPDGCAYLPGQRRWEYSPGHYGLKCRYCLHKPQGATRHAIEQKHEREIKKADRDFYGRSVIF